MCPVCILSGIVYGITSLFGLFGLTKLVKYIRLRYHFWSGTKCKKCKNNCEKWQ